MSFYEYHGKKERRLRSQNSFDLFLKASRSQMLFSPFTLPSGANTCLKLLVTLAPEKKII